MKKVSVILASFHEGTRLMFLFISNKKPGGLLGVCDKSHQNENRGLDK